jgi:hypothetical protein
LSQYRKKPEKELKAKVALEAIRNEKTTSQIVSQYEVQQSQVSKWKTKLLEEASEIFEDRRSREFKERDVEKREEEYQRQIGKMQMEIEWLKKKCKQIGL